MSFSALQLPIQDIFDDAAPAGAKAAAGEAARATTPWRCITFLYKTTLVLAELCYLDVTSHAKGSTAPKGWDTSGHGIGVETIVDELF
jgi:hypothetical protein